MFPLTGLAARENRVFYVTDLYSSLTRDANLYGTKRISIPQPRFLVFYNGKQKMPDRMTVKLSELYHKGEAPFELELEATILNINVGCNRELMDACKTLADYARYTQRVRDYAEDFSDLQRGSGSVWNRSLILLSEIILS